MVGMTATATASTAPTELKLHRASRVLEVVFGDGSR
jgi:DUF971 family protein